VFEICSEDEDECLQNLLTHYYSLLQNNMEDAKHVIMNCRDLSFDKIKLGDNKI